MIQLPFQQTFETPDLAVIALLIVLEGVLSIDNALVLGLLAKRLPKSQQGRALTYGLVGAFVFRFIAIATAAWLLHYRIVKLIGGLYLLYVAGKYFFFEAHGEESETIALSSTGEPVLVDEAGNPLSAAGEEDELEARVPVPPPEVTESQVVGQPGKYASFWPTVLVIELTDIAFAIDSILAAIALVGGAPDGHVGPHPKLWVVISGGMLGVILMRFAAVLFIKLLERFPRFEVSAFLLVAVIGIKLTADWGLNTPANPHVVDFHDVKHWAFWSFWVSMLLCLGVGFIPKIKKAGA